MVFAHTISYVLPVVLSMLCFQDPRNSALALRLLIGSIGLSPSAALGSAEGQLDLFRLSHYNAVREPGMNLPPVESMFRHSPRTL
jgi:hypothetical protein